MNSLSKVRQDLASSEFLHPGQLVVNSFATDDKEIGLLNATALENWYKDYAEKRNLGGGKVVFKQCVQSMIATSLNEIVDCRYIYIYI